MGDVTRLLESMHSGDRAAGDELMALVYGELRRIAASKMAREAPGHTLQATALVNEAWLRLAGDAPISFHSRHHFFGVAAEAMRRILVESARRRQSLKRGGKAERVELEDFHAIQSPPADELLAVHEALDLLAARDPVSAELVKLLYFTRMTMEEASAILGLPKRTAESRWTHARAWLRRAMDQTPKPQA